MQIAQHMGRSDFGLDSPTSTAIYDRPSRISSKTTRSVQDRNPLPSDRTCAFLKSSHCTVTACHDLPPQSMTQPERDLGDYRAVNTSCQHITHVGAKSDEHSMSVVRLISACGCNMLPHAGQWALYSTKLPAVPCQQCSVPNPMMALCYTTAGESTPIATDST